MSSLEDPRLSTYHPTDRLFAGFVGNEPFAAYLCQRAREGALSVSSGELSETLLISAHTLPPNDLIVHEKGRWYLKRLYNCLQDFLHHLERIRSAVVEPIDYPRLESEEQQRALEHAATYPLTLISGGPGTGKSTTAASFIEGFSGRIAVAAPTGKAAANLGAKVSVPVKTVHALIHEGVILPYDLLVIDEGSMIDAELMTTLFSKIKTGARVVLLGDKNQLPPVETGNLFAELFHLAKEAIVELKTCHRAELQEVIDMAAAVLKGEAIPTRQLDETLIDQLAAQLPLDRPYTDELAQEYTAFRALSALRRGPYGVDRLNRQLLERCSGAVPIMITENADGFVNGQTGFLWNSQAYFSGMKPLKESLLPRYELAFVLSIHKSQGSEYDTVWVLLPQGAERFGKELIYTGITRAKKGVVVWG